MLIILCNKSHSHNVYLFIYLSIIYLCIYIINLFDVVIFVRISLIVTHLLFSFFLSLFLSFFLFFPAQKVCFHCTLSKMFLAVKERIAAQLPLSQVGQSYWENTPCGQMMWFSDTSTQTS